MPRYSDQPKPPVITTPPPQAHAGCHCCGGSREMRRGIPCDVCSGTGHCGCC